MRKVGWVLAFVLFFSDLAFAGWKSTEWGMNLPQVLATFDGQAIPYQPGEIKGKGTFIGETALAYLPAYQVGAFTFEVRFNFDKANRLIGVFRVFQRMGEN